MLLKQRRSLNSVALAKVKRFLLGDREGYGMAFSTILYLLLVAIGFVYLFPLLFMFVTSMKSPSDILNSMVQWIPTQVYFDNYVRAFHVLDYPKTLVSSILASGVPSLIQTLVCSLVGYGLARYKFWGKTILFGLILATFIVPVQNTFIPQMLVYKEYGLLGNILCLIIPAFLGQGYRSAVFILIFYQTYLSMPKVLEEAARLDGADELKIFLTIAVPGALPAYIISMLFSTVWYWNETFLTVIFLGGSIQTLPLQLEKFVYAYQNLYPPGLASIYDRLNEAIRMSGTFLVILPLLVMYFLLQRWFVESVERSGITGE
jgi:multiple sugar transport system permease protein